MFQRPRSDARRPVVDLSVHVELPRPVVDLSVHVELPRPVVNLSAHVELPRDGNNVSKSNLAIEIGRSAEGNAVWPSSTWDPTSGSHLNTFP